MEFIRKPRLDKKIAIITGAASGIGRAAACLFAAEGARLVIADMNENGLDKTREMIRAGKGEATARITDVCIESESKSLVDLAVQTYGGLDILCNNAGITGKMNNPEEQDGRDWEQVYAVNVLGPVYTVKYATPYLIKSGKGAVVNTASVAGIRSGAGGNAYSASKAALINYTRTLACDLGGFNVRVNAVCPGLIETGMTQPIFDYARSKGKGDKLGSRCELRRYGNPEEVAWAMLFLASDEASYITGQALAVCGGNTASLNLPGMKA